MSNCQNINELISGFLDDELTQSDYQKVEVHLRTCNSCGKTLKEMQQLRQAVSVSQPRPQLEEERWERIMNDLPAGASRGIGWLLFTAGVMTLVALGIWEFAIDNQVSLPIKLATAGVWFGVLLLFLSVLRQRLLTLKTDKYRDVKY